MAAPQITKDFTNYDLLTTKSNRQDWSERLVHQVRVSLSSDDTVDTANTKGADFGKLLAVNANNTIKKLEAMNGPKFGETEFQGLVAAALAARFSSGSAAEGIEGLGWSDEVAQSFFRAAQYALITAVSQ